MSIYPLQCGPRVLRMTMSTGGRYFVVGDLYGAYTPVISAMKVANFDGTIDRLLSVGDLIDRGPQSWRCEQFLAQSYVHAIRGNHEDMLLALYKDGPPDDAVLQWAAKHNGLDWWLAIPVPQRERILVALAKLPTIIELQTPRGTVGLVHAEVPQGMNWATFVAEVESENEAVIEIALWGRNRLKTQDMSGVVGIGRLFVGHTPQWNGAQRIANIYHIDTGVVFHELGIKPEGRLSFFDVCTKTSILTAPETHRAIDIRENSADDLARSLGIPFGAYARSAGADQKLGKNTTFL